MHLNELKALHVSEVLKQAEELEIENTGRMRKQELMFAIIKKRARAGEQIIADGVLEILPDGFGFLRSPDTSYTASTDDIYISPSQVRRFNLHTGDMIEGEVRTPKDGERYFALNKLDKVNDGPPDGNKHKGKASRWQASELLMSLLDWQELKKQQEQECAGGTQEEERGEGAPLAVTQIREVIRSLTRLPFSDIHRPIINDNPLSWMLSPDEIAPFIKAFDEFLSLAA